MVALCLMVGAREAGVQAVLAAVVAIYIILIEMCKWCNYSKLDIWALIKVHIQ